MRRASLTFEFSDGTVRVVDVALAVRSASCKATKLVPMMLRTAEHFAAQVGWPQPILAAIVDDCGYPSERITGVVTFTGGSDAALLLTPIGSGLFAATWVPQQAQASLTLTLTAADAVTGLTGTVRATGTVSAAEAAVNP